jgi:hypothetical protein
MMDRGWRNFWSAALIALPSGNSETKLWSAAEIALPSGYSELGARNSELGDEFLVRCRDRVAVRVLGTRNSELGDEVLVRCRDSVAVWDLGTQKRR